MSQKAKAKTTDLPDRKELEAKVTVLQVAKAELDHLQPEREVYQRVGNILFRSDKTRASKSVADKLNVARAQLDKALSSSGGSSSGSGVAAGSK